MNKLIMMDHKVKTVSDLEDLLKATENLEFQLIDKKTTYDWIDGFLKKFNYLSASKKQKGILNNEKRRWTIIKDELLALRERYADERRTSIERELKEFSLEDIIAEGDVVVTITHGGFIKRFPVSGYRKQGRGGKGVTGAGTREEDFIEYQ